jgi:hypothetical protein
MGMFVFKFLPLSAHHCLDHGIKNARGLAQHQDPIRRFQGSPKAPFSAHHHVAIAKGREIDNRVIERRIDIIELAEGYKQARPNRGLYKDAGHQDEQNYDEKYRLRDDRCANQLPQLQFKETA